MPQEPAPPAPVLKKIDLTIARLRLMLADIHARDGAIEDQRRMANEQRAKLITFSIYGDATLDSVLAMLADVEERLAHFEGMARSLGAVRKRAEIELESLQLTKGIEEAKMLMQELKAQQAGSLTPDEIQTEIARLQALINEASERAAQTIGRRS